MTARYRRVRPPFRIRLGRDDRIVFLICSLALISLFYTNESPVKHTMDEGI